MSPKKKVSLLILLLIALIISCVYRHTNGFQEVQEPIIEDKAEEKIELLPKSEIVFPEDTDKKEENVKVDENIQNPSIVENEKTQTIIEEKEVIEEVTKEITEEITEEKVEEKIEEDLTPLITTDKRYKRIGTEKRIEELSRQTQELQIKINEYIRENPIVFKRASYIVVKKSLEPIKTIANYLKEYPTIKIEVAGHTDAAGARKLNQGISIGRAVAVKKELLKLGIDKNRIKARGYGEDIPIVKNNQNGYSRINRRVEFNIIEE